MLQQNFSIETYITAMSALLPTIKKSQDENALDENISKLQRYEILLIREISLKKLSEMSELTNEGDNITETLALYKSQKKADYWTKLKNSITTLISGVNKLQKQKNEIERLENRLKMILTLKKSMVADYEKLEKQLKGVDKFFTFIDLLKNTNSLTKIKEELVNRIENVAMTYAGRRAGSFLDMIDELQIEKANDISHQK